jgi:glutathione S-transferase
MSAYKLHYFPESGGCFKVAMMLAACGADWEPVFADFFSGVTRDPKWREEFNEMGELPVLEHEGKKFTQTGLILYYLAEKFERFGGRNADEKREIMRWMLFDNHKFTSYFVTHRFLRCGWLTPGSPPDPGVLAFLKGRIDTTFAIVEKHLAKSRFMIGDEPTIVDFSMSAYPFYPAVETGIDLQVAYPHMAAWLERIKALPGWKHPYDMMPGRRNQRWDWVQVPNPPRT